MKISCFTGAKDNQPQLLSITWQELADSFRYAVPANCTVSNCNKSTCQFKQGNAWSPAYYPENKTRSNTNVTAVSCLVLDLDHLTNNELDEALQKLANYKLIIHASHSDRPDDRCLRVILELTRSVKASEWNAFWETFVESLAIKVDPSTSDCARIYFAPTRSSDACDPAFDGTGYLFESKDGALLDVDAILSTVDYIDEDEDEAPVYQPPANFRGAPSEENWDKAIEVLSGGWPDNGRHDCHRALCGALARSGWPADLIADFVTEVCETAHPGNGNRNKRLKSAREAVSAMQEGRNVWGWPAVLEHIDPEVVDTTTTLLGFTPRVDNSFTAAMAQIPTTIAGVGKLVTLTRDQIQSNLQAAKRRLGNTSSPKKIFESKMLERAMKGLPFTDHADEDQDAAFLNGMQAVIKHAGKGAPDILVAEFLIKARPQSTVDELCEMISKAKKAEEEETLAQLPLDEFEMDLRTGKPATGSQHNMKLALRRSGITLYFDAFARKKVIETKIGDALYRETVEDHHVKKFMFETEQKYQFRPSKDLLFDFFDYKAYENRFHPVLDYLDGLEPWDGVSRTNTWLIDYAGAEDTPYVRAVSQLVLVAAVRRVREPGAKFDEMLILESPQGSLKSTAIRTLCPNGDWFTDNFSLDGDSKKMIEQTAGKWIIEAGELKGLSARDHNAMKQYLSIRYDEARMSYARETQRLPRQFIIIGTTNDTQYLRDHTGDRRYWPVRVKVFNVEMLNALREQLWAEASHLDLTVYAGEEVRLDKSLWDDAAVEQAKRRIDNPVKLKLEEYLGTKNGKIKVSDVWKLLTDDHVANQGLINQAGNAMQEMGWSRVRAAGGDRLYYYMRGTKEEMKRLLVVTGNISFGFEVKYADEPIPARPN